MQHSVYDITIVVKAPKADPTISLTIEEDIINSVADFPHHGLDITEISVDESDDGTVRIDTKISPQDYGVPQIGVELLAQWCEGRFTAKTPYTLEQVVIHPTKNMYGALIKFDRANRKLIIRRLE